MILFTLRAFTFCTMSAQHPVTVDVISDTICPWCFVGKRRLEAALARLPPAARAATSVHWRPFFLDPSLPPAGTDKLASYNAKFGAARVAAMLPQMQAVGAGEGIAFDFGGLVAATGTSHALLALAHARGGAPLQGALCEALFRYYFEARGNLGDAAGLRAVCAAAGLPAAAGDEELQALLAPPAPPGGPAHPVKARLLAAVEAEARAWRARHAVTGVPCFVLQRADGSGPPLVLPGAQDAGTLLAALERVAGGGAQ